MFSVNNEDGHSDRVWQTLCLLPLRFAKSFANAMGGI